MTTSAVETKYFDLPDKSGCRMAYRLHTPPASGSEQVPLVLINGLSAVMQDWSPLVEALSQTRPVLISDHRGIGASQLGDDWDGELSLLSMGLDVVDLCQHLNFSTVDLLGFSMGGHITQALLSDPTHAKPNPNPNGGVLIKSLTVRKAVLTATMVKLPRGDLDLMKLQAEAKKITDKSKRDEYITGEMMKMQYHPEVLGQGKPLQSKLEGRIKTALATSRPASIIAQQFFAIQGGDLRGQLSNIPSSLPVMVIHGKRDRMVLYPESDHILTGIPHAQRLANTPDDQFGHFWYDYFSIPFWNSAITQFLDLGIVGGQTTPKANL
ncbi:alpha/beta-hydrolase [Testicularia cyperi]|uniref:Alpha/beta-hydrolase n=1 Tax=Testicularia cyperi TaxID=1882483 RepID=A0A317XEF8_9BASI|nr:alpha/beta-hydrolase [Testicularia cyperi]